MAVLYRRARGAAWVGLAVNALLAIVKLFAGIVGQSVALIADAVNSIGDGLTSGVLLYALGVAERPADREHPYGHSRAEAVAAVTLAVIVGVSALAVAVEALRRIGQSHTVPPVWTLWIAGANVVIKEVMYRYKRRVAMQAGSKALEAGAWDHRSDALCSAAVLIGLAVVRYGGPGWVFADELAAIIVVGLIVIASAKLFRTGASQLMDEQWDAQTLAEIRRVAGQTPGVVRVEKVYARRSGLEAMVDIHIEVPGELTVDAGHAIAHRVQGRLTETLTCVSRVLVHIEPAVEPMDPAKR